MEANMLGIVLEPLSSGRCGGEGVQINPRLLKHRLVLLLVCILMGRLVMAQTAGTGALTGTITDSSGAVVPGVSVTTTSLDSGQVREVKTGPDGTYTLGLLPPGNYRVAIEAQGFQPETTPSITVLVTETAVLNQTLRVGSTTQAVTVTAELPTIQTTSSALGTVVNSQTAESLPLSTRNFTNLLTLSAGADAPIANSAVIGKSSAAIAVNGSDITQSVYLQDGVSVNNWLSVNTGQEGSQYGSFPIPNPDTIQEFKIQTSNYDAGYGRNPGANVDVITKSGTNDFHGSVFEFFRNTALNANDFFRNATGGSKLVLDQNQYGGTVGGPVKKDKLFFFVSYQETDQKNGISGFGYSTVILPPIPAGNRGSCPPGWTSLSQCNAAAQTFVPALGAAVCPANNPGNKSDSIKTVGSITVACNGSNINPAAINILQLQSPNGSYLIPGSGSSSGQYLTQSFSDPATYLDHQGMGNWDYIVNAKNTLSGRYYYETDPTSAPFAASGTSTTASSILPGNPVTSDKTNEVSLLRLTTILSNNTVNEARVSYQRVYTTATEGTPFTNSEVGITDVSPALNYLDNVSISGLFSFGANQFSVENVVDNQVQWADQISWTHGKHSVRTGVEVQRIDGNMSLGGNGIGKPSFSSFPDFLIGRAACPAGTYGTGPGQCNANNPGSSNGTQTSSLSGFSGTVDSQYEYLFRVTTLDWFVQDDVKVNSKLTLNLGLRWEWDGYPIEKDGNISDLWPNLLNTVPVPGSGCSSPGGVAIGAGATGTGCSLVGFVVPSNYHGPIPTGVYQNTTASVTASSTPWDDFAPRAGFAWRPTASDRLVVRGGGGYFYDFVNGTETALHPLVGTPAEGVLAAQPSSSLANPVVLPGVIPSFPGSFGFTPRWANLTTGQTSNLSITSLAPNLSVPVSYEWNLNVQYEFLRNWVLELGYVGSHGIHQMQPGGGGSPGGGADPFNWATLVSPADPGVTGLTTNTIANVYLRVPDIGISPGSSQYKTASSYKYNALQTTVSTRLSHGLHFQAAYTWDRAFDTNFYGINTPPYDIMQEAPNTVYHPQRLVISYSWNLPFGHRAGIVGRLVNDWIWSGVTTIQDGTPLTIFDSSGGTVFYGTASAGISPANLCPGASISEAETSGPLTSRLNNYFNKTGVFCSEPLLGSDGVATGYGDGGQGIVSGPPQNNWDMSLGKLIKVGGLREDATLQFRGEFFNTFNHPQFALPQVVSGANNSALNVNNSAFGTITSTAVNPRLVQLVLKYSF